MCTNNYQNESISIHKCSPPSPGADPCPLFFASYSLVCGVFWSSIRVAFACKVASCPANFQECPAGCRYTSLSDACLFSVGACAISNQEERHKGSKRDSMHRCCSTQSICRSVCMDPCFLLAWLMLHGVIPMFSRQTLFRTFSEDTKSYFVGIWLLLRVCCLDFLPPARGL